MSMRSIRPIACSSACLGRRCSGFLLPDVLMGIAMAVTLLGVLAVASGEYRRGSMTLADQRTAQRLAEQAIRDLRTGATVEPAAQAGDGRGAVRVKRLGETPGVKGQVWVEVRVTYRRQSATLVGLAPSSAAEAKP